MASSDVEIIVNRYAHPELAPESVKQRNAMIDRLMADKPVVPTRANGGKEDGEVEAPVETESVIKDEITGEESFQYPDEVVEPAPPPTPFQTIADEIPAKLEARPEPVIRGTQMTFEEMRDHVLTKCTPEELLGLMLSRLKTKEKLKLKEGRFSFPIDIVLFSSNVNVVTFYMDKEAAKDIRFDEGARYTFEYQSTAYKDMMFLGSIFPSTNFPYPLMSFLRDEAEQP